MKSKKQHHEEHVDETWLIPYADMLTLLLALFIVMFAMSKVDKEKLRAASEQFNVIFSGAGTMEKDGSSTIPLEVEGQDEATKGTIEDDKMKEVKNSLEKEIESKGYSDQVKVELNKEGLEISIQDAVLFNSGEAELLKQVYPLMQQICTMIQNLDNSIKVVGHTDNVPIHNGKFRSNWDLSSMRAVNVMNFMVDYGRLSPEKFSVQAYGEYKPRYDNYTVEGRAKNRRVEIFIIRKYQTNTNETKKQ